MSIQRRDDEGCGFHLFLLSRRKWQSNHLAQESSHNSLDRRERHTLFTCFFVHVELAVKFDHDGCDPLVFAVKLQRDVGGVWPREAYNARPVAGHVTIRNVITEGLNLRMHDARTSRGQPPSSVVFESYNFMDPRSHVNARQRFVAPGGLRC
jgi:hypothetical protein